MDTHTDSARSGYFRVLWSDDSGDHRSDAFATWTDAEAYRVELQVHGALLSCVVWY